MRESKRTKELIRKLKRQSITLAAYLLLIVAEVTLGKSISRVEGMVILEGRNTEKMGLARFSGSLIENIDQKKNTTKLIFGFRLLEEEDGIAFKKSLRVQLEVILDPRKLSDGVYNDHFNQDEQNRFSLNLYKENAFYRGVEPRTQLKRLKIGHLTIKASLSQKGDKFSEVHLKTLSLLLSDSGDLGHAYSLNFTSTKNRKEILGGFWRWYSLNTPWLFPLLFFYTAVYLFMGVIFFFLSKATAKYPINCIIQGDKGISSTKQNFLTFYVLKFLSFLSLIFLYRSIWSLLFFLGLLLVDLFAQFFVWFIPNFVYWSVLGQDCLWEMHVEPLVLFLGLAVSWKDALKMLKKKNLIGILVGLIGVVLAVRYPSVILGSIHWLLAAGAVYCSIFGKYENPTLLDFFASMASLWLLISYSFLHVNWFLSTAYNSVFFGGSLSYWLELVGLQWKGVFLSLVVMAGLIFLDFIFIKTKFKQVFCPKRIKYSGKIPKIKAKHQPGVVFFNDDSDRPRLRTPLISGRYKSFTDAPWRIEFDFFHLEKKVKKNQNWRIDLTFRFLEGIHFLIEQVICNGKDRPELVALFRITKNQDTANLTLKLFSLRTRRVELTTSYKIDSQKANKVRFESRPKALQIEETYRIKIFFTRWETHNDRPLDTFFYFKREGEQLGVWDLDPSRGEAEVVRVRSFDEF